MAGGVMGELQETREERDRIAAQLEEAEASNQELRLRMESIAQGGDDKAELLDTDLLRLTAFDNRDPKSFDDDDRDFRELKEDIGAQNGNLIPGLVRPLEKPEGKVLYEVVYGNRRMMACRRLGLKFKAFIQSIPDDEAMLLQHVENAHRKNLSSIETAQKVQSFLKHRRYNESGRAKLGSLALLSETLKLNKNHVGKLALIGQIPDQVLEAIPDIREIPFRPAYQLAKACRDTLPEVQARIPSINASWKPRKVVNHLVGSAPTKPPQSTPALHLTMPDDRVAREAFQKELATLADKYGVTFKAMEAASVSPP